MRFLRYHYGLLWTLQQLLPGRFSVENLEYFCDVSM